MTSPLDDKDTWVDPLNPTPESKAAQLQEEIYDCKRRFREIKQRFQYDLEMLERELAELKALMAQGFIYEWPNGRRR